MLATLPLPQDAEILEAGFAARAGFWSCCRNLAACTAPELSDVAREIANGRNKGEVLPGRLPEEIPFGDKEVRPDCVDRRAGASRRRRGLVATALRARLKPGGWLLLTVPACPFLWSRHDETHHHKRRYMRPLLKSVVEQAGFTIQFNSYYNTVLFPLVVALRALKRAAHRDTDDQQLPSPEINALLTRLFASERSVLARRIRLPIGVSLLCVAQNPNQVQS